MTFGTGVSLKVQVRFHLLTRSSLSFNWLKLLEMIVSGEQHKVLISYLIRALATLSLFFQVNI